MNAADVKERLRARHPAIDAFGGPYTWTCIEEWMNIDLLAVSAWASCRPYPRYARVGYEVKVSRADYRRELARPDKRAAAVRFCHEFYFAVPHGLLKPDEIQWVPPWGFNEETMPLQPGGCPGAYGHLCLQGRLRSSFRPDAAGRPVWNRRLGGECPTCWGTGSLAASPAVRAGAPYLWVPDDVGLAVIYPETGRVVIAKKAPRRSPDVKLNDHQFGDLIRWVSFRPDPRHAVARALALEGPAAVASGTQ